MTTDNLGGSYVGSVGCRYERRKNAGRSVEEQRIFYVTVE